MALRVEVGSGVADGLRRAQRPDGSWANAENLVKEGVPLIATGFAVRALVAPSSRGAANAGDLVPGEF